MTQKLFIKVIIFIIIVNISLVFSSCDFINARRIQSVFGISLNLNKDSIFREPGHVSFIPSDFNETSRLFYLCKVWGFVKYYHENESFDLIDVDNILLQSIPKIIKITNKNEFCDTILNLIKSIQVSPLKGNNPYPDIKNYCLVNNDWMKDSICLNKDVTQKLKELFFAHTGIKNNFVFNRGNAGTIRQSNEKTYYYFNDEKIRLLGLFRYWNVINFFYPSKNHIDESWDKSLYESIPLFRDIRSKEEYHREIYRLTNRLKDSHTSYPPSIDTVVFGPYRPNFRMLNIQDTFIINKIRFPENNTEYFMPGDIVLQVDGKNVHQIYDSLQNFVGGGNYWSNQSFVCNAVLSSQDSTTMFTILRGEDTLVVNSKNRKAWDLFQQKKNQKKQNEKKVLYKRVTDSVAYLDLRSVTPGNFNKNYKPIKHAKTIILDLRCYPHTYLIADLAENFVPPFSIFAYVTYADYRFPGMLRFHISSKYVGHKNYFKGRVIVLVNEWTQSFSEYVTMLLQANPNTITVGSSSSGADGNISTLKFPGEVRTIYSGIGIYYPGMIPTQRVGVKINYFVEPSVESIKKGVDIVLEKAISLSTQHSYEGN